MTLGELVNKQGPLAETYPLFDPDTIQHSDEITNNRKTDKDLRHKSFYTADHALYTVEKGEVILYLGTRETNPIFKNIKEATKQLINKDGYIPKKEDIETVINARSTLRTKLSDLKLEEQNNEHGYFEIDTSDYDNTLNNTQKAFAERVYGQGDEFEKSMKMFPKAISTTRIYVLNSNYVKKHVEKDSALARTCWLGSFDLSSYFIAADKGVGYPSGALRGELKPAEGGGKKSEDPIYQ